MAKCEFYFLRVPLSWAARAGGSGQLGLLDPPLGVLLLPCSSTAAWRVVAVDAVAGPTRLWLGRLRSQGLGWLPCCWWVRTVEACCGRHDRALGRSGLPGLAYLHVLSAPV